MPKISHVIGEGPELSRSQAQVLDLLEKHPDYIFRMQNDDLQELQSWVSSPDAEEPPFPAITGPTTPALGTIRWAISTLHSRDKIGSIKLNRRTYYGSHNAIEAARSEENRRGHEFVKRMRVLQEEGEERTRATQENQ